MWRWMFISVVLAAMLLPVPSHAQNLVPNGGFDAPEDPLMGWIVDYAWLGNQHYVGNASRVSVAAQEGGQRNVAHLRSPGDAGVKLETLLIPFEQGARYRATVKLKGGPYRVYFSGYQWKPGIQPHGAPTIGEMRPAYRSNAEAGEAQSWKTVTLEIPGASASESSLQNLRKVRFITLYFWFVGDGFVDDVVITKVGSR